MTEIAPEQDLIRRSELVLGCESYIDLDMEARMMPFIRVSRLIGELVAKA